MVVIAIIGLLSSIVLASLKDARDKSTTAKFKSEINQLVTALELYKSNTGKYPYEDGYTTTSYEALVNNASTETSSPAGQLLSTTLAGKYLKSLPKVPTNNYNQTQRAWAYFTNNPTFYPKYRCVGDSTIPKYVIMFSTLNPFIFSSFSDLPSTEAQTSNGSSWIGFGDRCFSIK